MSNIFDENRPPQKRRLEVDLLFLERTFRTRAMTEELLNPEREAGVINPDDYNAAVRFFPNSLRRNYNTIGTVAGAGFGYYVRQPKWTPGKLGTVVLMSALTGRAMGSAYSVFSAYKFFAGLRDPEGFGVALDNVKQRIERPSSGPAVSEFPPTHDAPAPTAPVIVPSSELDDTTTSPSTAQTTNAWDRIRAANTKQAQQSSWDALRQSHERSRIPSSKQDPASPSLAGDGSRFYDETDRAAEQAKFNELLERERNFK